MKNSRNSKQQKQQRHSNDQLSMQSQQEDQLNQNQQNLQDNQQEQEIDYQNIFEEARRQQVLRNINQNQNHSDSQSSVGQNHEQVQQILSRRAKRQENKQKKRQKDEMKKLRQQNALQFFRKIKMQLLLSFRESILDAKQAYRQRQQKIPRMLSCFNIQTINQFHKLKQQNHITRKQFIQFLHKIFTQNNIQLKNKQKYLMIWSIAIELKIGYRKLSFIDISQMQLQSFYNLKYIATKSKTKKISKQIDILKNKLQRKIVEQQLKDKNFISIQQYAFDPKMLTQNNNTTLTQSQTQTHNSINTQSQNSLKTSNSKLQQIKQLKRTFHKSYCQIYCPIQNNWQIFNTQILKLQSLTQLKNEILQSKAIIGFYSTKIINFKPKYKQLLKYRLLNNIEIRDQTVDFCDKYQLIIKRRHRLGCKNLYKIIMKQANIFKNMDILQQFDRMLIQKQKQKQMEWAMKNFPKSVKQMRLSDYFVTPSLVQKYMILKQNAKPIPNTQFHQQKVYHKSDLQKVSSRMGWIDYNRMVKQNQIPVKTTENKNKTTTKLYKFNQTQPFMIMITNEGQFVLDQQYNSIYVPPKFQIPQGFVLIHQNVQYLCKRNKFKCARIVQGFDVAGSHLIPNNIGFLVQQKYQQQIQKMYKQKQQKLRIKKQQRKTQNAMSLWRKLFKSIIITKQIHKN